MPTSIGPVAYAGEPGAFAEDAVLAHLGDVPRVAQPGFRDVFEAVSDGRAAAGVVPIENLVNGTVRENYDLLLEHDLVIVGEVVVPVRLCLAALPGQGLDDIERVYSHIQALGQAEAFLRTRPWTLLTTYNTAGAGKLIAERGERGAAAVLSPRAAALFGLAVLADGIQSVPDNRTRFLVIARPDAEAPAPAATPRPARPAGPPWCSRSATSRARCSPCSRCSPRAASTSRRSSRDPAASGPGSTSSGPTSTSTPPSRRWRPRSRTLAPITTMVRVLGSYPRATVG